MLDNVMALASWSNQAHADLLALTPAALAGRSAMPPINSMEPAPPCSLPLGSLRIAPFGELSERYVDVLTEAPVNNLLLAEPEHLIRLHPTYERYLEMAREGHAPPPVQVNANAQGDLICANRRRLMVARDLGITTLKAWLSPIDPVTGDPLKYGHLLEAAGLALPPHEHALPTPLSLANEHLIDESPSPCV